MSSPRSPVQPDRVGSDRPQPAPFVSTPHAERYLLEADNLRRRQLRSALLHGSSRTWRDRRRIWPAVVAGIVLTAIVSAAIAITGTFQQQQRARQEAELERLNEQQQREGQQVGGQQSGEPEPTAEPELTGEAIQLLPVVRVARDPAGWMMSRLGDTTGGTGGAR